MPLFRKKQASSITDLEAYYAQKNGGFRSWGLALLSLLITVAVLSLLFFAGRAIYRAVTDDTTNQTTSQPEEASSPNQNDESVISTPPTTTVTPEEAGVVSDEAARTNQPQTSTAPVAPTENLPSTGTAETVAIIFMVATAALGYLTARSRYASKL